MNPKEKALELYSKMYGITPVRDKIKEIKKDQKLAKQCALLAVDEILFSNNTYFETNMPHECWKYWLEVKQEIEKL